MYKIKNITGGKVLLGDLSNLILQKNEELDLDNMFSRDVINASRDLEKATNPQKRILTIIHKDTYTIPDGFARKLDKEPPLQPQIDPDIIETMIKKTLTELGVGVKDNTHDKLDAILAAIGHNSDRGIPLEKPVNTPEEIDKDTSVDIQTKLLKRLQNNVESSVKTKETTKDSADIEKNADDLGNLLGDL